MCKTNSDKNITVRYCLQQTLYWSAVTGIGSFAATYLQDKGFTAAQVGWILFGAYLGSFLLQPVVAGFADRAKKNILSKLMLVFGSISFCCFTSVWLIKPPLAVFAALYLVGYMFFDMQIPLLNSINVYYASRSWKLNYGLARGLGGAGFALASLLLGFIAEKAGTDWIVIFSIILIVFYEILSVTYPRDDSTIENGNGEAVRNSSSLFEFVVKYKWYCVSLLGIMFLAIFHLMTENYLINILGRLGGDKSNVGVALFICTVTELPLMTIFIKFYNRFGSQRIILTSAVCYLIKAILFMTAKSVSAIYLAQILQCVTYVPVSMIQTYYARECTQNCDMIKGQSFVTAFFTLGCALGNLLGGNLISSFGVPVLLYAGVAVAMTGLIILLLTTRKALSVFKV